jgi:hypothetical protein
MKGFGMRRASKPTLGYCRRENRVYTGCPLQGNWETCAVNANCLLVAAAEPPPNGRRSGIGPPDSPLQMPGSEPSPEPWRLGP